MNDFSQYMNIPVDSGNDAYIDYDYKQMKNFVFCPHCGKKNFPIDENTKIQNLRYKCRGSNCKRMFNVNV